MNDESALEQLLKSNEYLHHLDMDRKTADIVFDRRTIRAIYKLMSDRTVDYLDYPVSSGKESIVFKVYSRNKPLALKVYKLSTLRFGSVWRYIEGDRRFSKEQIKRSTIVFLWAKKEFVNMTELRKQMIPAPRPVVYYRNLLLMSYLGSSVSPAPMLKNFNGDFKEAYVEVSDSMRIMNMKARLVHADLSEYNILCFRKKFYFIDLGQAVSLEHPWAEYFLQRDIRNMVNFFTKKGIKTGIDELYEYVTGNKRRTDFITQ